MINPKEKLEVLRKENPFVSSSAGDPWQNRYPDVPEINLSSYQLILDIIAQKQAELQNNIACLVLGEAGSGKTHLIARLLSQSQQRKRPYLFAYIQPIEDPDQTYRYLLRELVISLCKPLKQDPDSNQFDLLLGKIFCELLQKKIKVKNTGTEEHRKLITALKKDPLHYKKSDELLSLIKHSAFERIGRQYLISQLVDIDETLLSVLFKFRLESTRSLALSWMKGIILDDLDNESLQVQSRAGRSEASLEQEAQLILYSIGSLLARYQQMVIVCFDRLENLSTQDQKRSLGKMVEFLVDKAPAILPIVFIRGQLWEEEFLQELDSHITTRLQTNQTVLKGCGMDQSLAIVRSRLSYAYGETVNGDLFPFNLETLTNSFQAELLSPREVIIEANELLRSRLGDTGPALHTSPGETLYGLYYDEYQQILKNFKDHAPDRMRLRRTLGLYLQTIPDELGINIKSLWSSDNDKQVVDFICNAFDGDNDCFDISFIIDDSLHHKTVNAKLQRGLQLLANNPNDRVYYIREKRSSFPGPEIWKVTNKTLRKFKNKGGVALRLTKNQAAAWYALSYLQYRVVEGDAFVLGENNRTRSISHEEFLAFIKDYLHNPKSLSLYDLDELLVKRRTDRIKRKRLHKLSVLNIH